MDRSDYMPPFVCQATIVIVTRDRCALALRAARSAVAQVGEHEVLVIDDGSSDRTSDMVKAHLPEVRCVRFDERAGLVVRRNEAASMARGEVIISIDDDAAFSSSDVVRDVLDDMDADWVGAVAIPYFDTAGENPGHLDRAATQERMLVTAAFRGCAYAVRRDLFLALGGFSSDIVHQGEERDFCLRLLRAGYFVRVGTSNAVRHDVSDLGRDVARMDEYGRRNEILFSWKYFAGWRAVAVGGGFALRGLATGIRLGRVRHHLKGIVAGLRVIKVADKATRCPLSATERRLHRAIRSRGVADIQEVIGLMGKARKERSRSPSGYIR